MQKKNAHRNVKSASQSTNKKHDVNMTFKLRNSQNVMFGQNYQRLSLAETVWYSCDNVDISEHTEMQIHFTDDNYSFNRVDTALTE